MKQKTYCYLGLMTCFFILFILGCRDKQAAEIPINNTVDPLEELTEKALRNGDTSAYDQLSIEYIDSPYTGFLYTALMMANKFQYQRAYIDVYYCLTDLHHKKDGTELDDLDERTRSLALEYLMKGVDRGNKECMGILGGFYVDGRYIERDQRKGEMLLEASRK